MIGIGPRTTLATYNLRQMYRVSIEFVDRRFDQLSIFTKFVRIKASRVSRREPLPSGARRNSRFAATNARAQCVLLQVSSRHDVFLDQPRSERNCEREEEARQHQSIDALA